jgi:hypothetical protein
MPPVGPRKLLVAAIGVATINYVATACHETPTSGNLPAPREPVPVSGNLPAPPPEDAAPPPAASSVTPPSTPVAGNLPAPPPQPVDAGKPKTPGGKK